MNLYAHQSSFLDKKLNRSALIWSCGTGKTITALEWSKQDIYHTTLIICPKALKTNWKNGVEKINRRKEAYRILTKEEFSKQASSLPYFGQVIVDEIHIGFLTPNFRSDMSKALRGYLKKHSILRFLGLTATPYTSNPWQIYNLAYYIGRRWDWNDFSRKFFDQVRFGPRIVPVPKKGCEKKLAELVKEFADVVDIYDVMNDVPLQHHTEPEYFSLTTRQKKLIKESYDPLPIVRFTREHIIEQNGDKIERLKSLVAENPKIAVVCRYTEQIDLLAYVLADYGPLYIIRGDVKDRDSVCRAAEAASTAVVLIQADCGVGFELPSFPVCVYASMSYSYTSWEQMNGRFLRMNKPSRTTFIYLLTDGDSVDKAVYDAVKRKEDFKIELFKKHAPILQTKQTK